MYWPRRRRKTKSCTPYSHGSAPPLSGSTTSPYNICPQGPHRLLACISAAGRTTPRFGAHTKRRSHKQDFQNINAWEVHHRVSRKSSQLTCWIRPSTNPSPPAVHQNGQPSLRSSPAHHRPQPRRLHALAAESASRLGTSRKQPSPRGGDDVGTYTLTARYTSPFPATARLQHAQRPLPQLEIRPALGGTHPHKEPITAQDVRL